MAVTTGGANDDGRDTVADPLVTADQEIENPIAKKDAGKERSTTSPSGAPTSLPLLQSANSQQAVVVDPSLPERAVANRSLVKLKPTAVANQRLVKPTTTTNRRPIKPAASTRKPPVSPTSNTAVGRNTVRSLGFKKMSTTSGSQAPLSQASQAPSDSLPLSASPQPESENESRPIEIEDDDMEVEEEEDGVEAGSKRKLTSTVWTEFKRVKFNGTVRAKCIYCFKQLSATSTNGTKHLHVHLKGCVQRKIKLNGITVS